MSVAAARVEPMAARLTRLADWLAVALAVSLPWSTSVTTILAGAWVVVALFTLDRESMERVRSMAAVVLPLAIVIYAIAAVAWSDVAWPLRLRSLPAVVKLAAIPLLLIHFRRTGACGPVFAGFFMSCCVLFVASWLLVLALTLDPTWSWPYADWGVPVKDYISQSGFFSICIVVLLDRALSARNTSPRTTALYLVGAALFFINIIFVATGRTSLIVLAVLLLLLGAMRLKPRPFLLFVGFLVALAAVSWTSSPYLRHRITNVAEEIKAFRANEVDTSSGARIEFWKHSVEIVKEAPLLGHGAGSTREAMSRSFGVDPKSSGAPSNPHNQILATAIPYGLVGVVLLIAMWLAHLRLFLAPGPVAFIGLAIVMQNIVGGLFNSHLFDFTQGWFYVLGVGIAGGALLHQRDVDAPR
jgi:O-antigen ligase